MGPRGDFPITGGSLNSETETITYRDFGPSGSYDDGEYDTGVINIGDESGDYANYAEDKRKEWGIEL